MVVDQLVKVKWNGANKNYYVSKGYKYTKLGDEFEVAVNDLSVGSHSSVRFVCDYCNGKNQVEENSNWKVYKQLLVQRKKNNKDCCNHDDCKMKKHWEMRMINVVKNKNTLGDKYPHLIEEWSNKNPKSPFEYTVASEYKVWWKCKEKGHEWESHVKNRTVHSTGCPYCAGVLVCDDTSLAFTHPTLVREWHPTKNVEISPYGISKGSQKKVWWLGECGHEWESDVTHRVHGKGCPFCSGRKVNSDNCLTNNSPHIASQWNYEKNLDITPDHVTCGSNRMAWWICDEGHEWEAVISSRAANGNGCPYCTGRKVNQDNCLVTLNPILALDWNFKKNELTPFEITAGSNKIVWWICSICSHEWESTVSNRTIGNGCPQCKESKGEKTVRSFLERNRVKFITQYGFANLLGIGGKNLKFDFAIFDNKENLLLLVEYDGEFHFRKIYKDDGYEMIVIHDKRKNTFCENNRIPLLRIPYWEFDNIDSILQKELNKYKITFS